MTGLKIDFYCVFVFRSIISRLSDAVRDALVFACRDY